MAFFSFARWFRTLSRRPGRTLRNKRPVYFRLDLEALEDRTLLSVLPAPVVTNPTSLGAGISPQVVYDPLNPSDLCGSQQHHHRHYGAIFH